MKHLLSTWRKKATSHVLYDPDCPFCSKQIQRAKRLDWLQLLHIQPTNTAEVIQQYHLDPAKVSGKIYTTKDGQTLQEGLDSLINLNKRVILLWPIALSLLLLKWIKLGQKTYDWLLKRSLRSSDQPTALNQQTK